MLIRRSNIIFSVNHAIKTRPYTKGTRQEKELLKEEKLLVEVLRPLERFTRHLIDASAAGNANINHRDGVQLWSTISQVTKPNGGVPSLEKARFIGEGKQLFEIDDPLRAKPTLENFPPGTFVEIRRNQVITLGVILQQQIIDARNYAITLTYTGEIWPHLISDITFSIPNFVPQDLIQRSGSTYGTNGDAETAARLAIVQRVRTFARQHERNFMSMGKGFAKLYEAVRHPDPQRWIEVTTQEAARHLNMEKPLPILRLFAVHSHMMNRPLYFVADPRNHKSTHRFSARPLSHVQTILQVNEWARTFDPALRAFVEKAGPIITKAREIRQNSGESPPTIVRTSFERWSPTDLTIIQYLQNSLRVTRTIQSDPYENGLPNIVKRLGLYKDCVVNSTLIHTLLCELGVLTPWEDVVMRTPELNLDFAPPGESQEAQALNELVDYNRRFHDKPVEYSLKLKLRNLHFEGSTELYEKDPHEDVRHDFGDLPVYVVDDVQAHELDDGLSIQPVIGEDGSYWVHIHVADPTTVLPPGHVLDLQARASAATVYSAHRAWPMLPHALTQPRFSLGSKPEGEAQEVLTFSVKLTDRGDFLDYKVRAGLVRNVHVLQYHQVDHLLGIEYLRYTYPLGIRLPGTPVEPIARIFHSDLKKLHDIADTISRRTVNEHPILSFDFPDAGVAFDETPLPSNPTNTRGPVLWKGYPSSTYYVEQSQSDDVSFRRIVAEYMKLACRAASRFCVDKGVPAIRRASAPLSTAVEKDMAEVLAMRSPTGHVDPIECIKRSLYAPPGEPTLEPLEHWSLAVPKGEGYARVTSPLRRYTDLTTHWQIKHELLPVSKRTASGPLFPPDYLRSIMMRLYDKEKASSSAASAYQKYWALAYLKRYIENKRKKHGPDYNCFPDLSAQTIGNAGYDTRHGTGQVPVAIHVLGIRGILKGIEPRVTIPIGTIFPVKITEIELGLAPTMILAPA